MLQTELSIQNYLLQQSKGAVKISQQQARDIINLVTGQPAPQQAYAKLYRYNSTNKQWEHIRNAPATDADITRETIEALDKLPADRCYRWECYNSAGDLEGNIYTINTNLF